MLLQLVITYRSAPSREKPDRRVGAGVAWGSIGHDGIAISASSGRPNAGGPGSSERRAWHEDRPVLGTAWLVSGPGPARVVAPHLPTDLQAYALGQLIFANALTRAPAKRV